MCAGLVSSRNAENEGSDPEAITQQDALKRESIALAFGATSFYPRMPLAPEVERTLQDLQENRQTNSNIWSFICQALIP